MEQKKILWVILSVSLFVLVIFGAALVLCLPASNARAVQGEMIPYECSSAACIDPDAWARDPDKIASLDKNAPTSPSNIINLNNVIITGDGQGEKTDGIDVSDLTEQEKEGELSGLPPELAEQIGIASAKQEKDASSEGKHSSSDTQVGQKDSGATKEAEKTAVENRASVHGQRVHEGQVAAAKAGATSKGKLATKSKEQASRVRTASTKTASAKAASTKAAPKIRTVYWVQTASLADRMNAERARDTLAAQHMRVEVFTRASASGLTHRVRVGPFSNNTEAAYWLNNIKTVKGFEKSYVTEETVSL